MKIGIIGKPFEIHFDSVIKRLFNRLHTEKVEVYLYEPFLEFLREKNLLPQEISGTFTSHTDTPESLDLMISLGGDGTFLSTVSIVRESGTPIVGVNMGRLGFLANISISGLDDALDLLLSKSFTYDERTLISVECSIPVLGEFSYALNEVTIQKKGTSLITIHTWCDNEFITSYWADGLIISTPTGSSAYSLSVGGPIVAPQCRNFILSPIAPHNLNVRPLVLPDSAVLRLQAESRYQEFYVTADSRFHVCTNGVEIILRRAPFTINVVNATPFFSTLRNKLMWGADKRN